MKREDPSRVLWDTGLLQDTRLLQDMQPPVASAAAGAGRTRLNMLRQAGERLLSS